MLFLYALPGLLDMRTYQGCVEPAPGGTEVYTLKCLEPAFNNIVVVSTYFVGLILLVMFVIGGIRFLTSGGDPKATAGAKNTLTYAFFGFILFLASFLILRFISAFTGIDLTVFHIYLVPTPT